MNNDEVYFNYLKQRSFTGDIYRKYWLYPRLSKWLKGKVLDVGCGIGDFLKFRPGSVGIDINYKNINWCQENELNAHLMEIDKIPFENASFDSVMLDNVLEHIEHPEALLSEIHRVLSDSGIFVVGVPGTLGYTMDPDHKAFYNRDRLEGCLLQSGFEKIKIAAFPFNWSWLDKKISQYCLYGQFKKR